MLNHRMAVMARVIYCDRKGLHETSSTNKLHKLNRKITLEGVKTTNTCIIPFEIHVKDQISPSVAQMRDATMHRVGHRRHHTGLN